MAGYDESHLAQALVTSMVVNSSYPVLAGEPMNQAMLNEMNASMNRLATPIHEHVISWVNSLDITTLTIPWSKITNTPTTHAGYGITDNPSGGGGLLVNGTPAINQLTIFDSASAVRGDSKLTWNGSVLTIDGSISATGEITAFSSGAPPASFWDSLPHRYSIDYVPSTTGFLQLVNDVASPGNNQVYGTDGSGIRGWYTMTGGTTVHSSLSNLDYASAGHTGFAPTLHNHAWGDITSGVPSTFTPSTHGNSAHSETYITASALTPYAPLASPAFTGTPTINGGLGMQSGAATKWTIVTNTTPFELLFKNASNDIKATLDQNGNLFVYGDICAFASTTSPPNWWDNLPIASTTVLGGVKIDGTTITINSGVISVSAGGGMVYPGTGVAVSTGTSWGTSLNATNLSSLAGLSYSSAAFVKMTGSGTFTLDTNTYLTSIPADVVRTGQVNVYDDFAQTFKDNIIRINNPADTFYYTLTAGAIAANRILNLPVITGTDTLGALGMSQTWAGVNTFYSGNRINNPANTYYYTLTSAALAANRVLNLPLTTATDTLATLGLAQSFTATQTFSGATVNGNLIMQESGSQKFVIQVGATTFPLVFKAADGTTTIAQLDQSGNLLCQGDITAYATGGGASLWAGMPVRWSIVYSGGYFNLSGDADTPGNDKFYGTNGSGVKGWYTVPTGVSSQWTTTGNDIYYSTGHVMIGTNSAPSSTLHIYEATNQQVAIFQSTRSGATDGTYIALYDNTNGVAHTNVTIGSVGGNLIFNGTGANVGIGTTAPLTAFQVNGIFGIYNGASGNIGGINITPSNTDTIISNNSPGAYGDYGMRFKTMQVTGGSQYNDVLYLGWNAKVGIGYVSPYFGLGFYRSADTYMQFMNSGTGTSGTDGTLLGLDSTSSIFSIRNRENAGIQMWTNDTLRASLTSEGHLGVGVSGPTYRTEIYWDNSANFTHAYGLKITAITTTGGSGKTYGLWVDAHGSDDGNYAAIFENGYIGVSTSAPTSQMDLYGAWSSPSTVSNAYSLASWRVGGHVQIALSIRQSSPYSAAFQVKHSTSDGNTYPLELNPLGGYVGVGRTPTNFNFEVQGDIWAYNGWYRVNADKGMYFQDYGGGIYMTDSSYVQTYNNKAFKIRYDNANANGGRLFLENNTYGGSVGAGCDIIFGMYSDTINPRRYGRIHSYGGGSGTVESLRFSISDDTEYEHMRISASAITTRKMIYVSHIDGKGWDDMSTAGNLYLNYNNNSYNTLIGSTHTDTGKFGVFTNSPYYWIDMQHSATDRAILGVTGLSTAGTYIQWDESGTKGWAAGIDDASTTFRIREDGYNGTTRFTLNNSGGFSIGSLTGTTTELSFTSPATSSSAGYNMELYSANQGNPAYYIGIRFHHAGQTWGQLRFNNAGFSFTNGSDATLTAMNCSNMYSSVNAGIGTAAVSNVTLTLSRTAGYASIKSTGDMILEPASGYDTYISNYQSGNIYLNGGGGNVRAYGEVTAYYSSDRRLKQNINYEWSGLDLIGRMRPALYNWNNTAIMLNSEKDNYQTNYGMIADELIGVTPSLIHSIYGKYQSIDYLQIVPILVRAVQELRQENIELKAKVEKLNN